MPSVRSDLRGATMVGEIVRVLVVVERAAAAAVVDAAADGCLDVSTGASSIQHPPPKHLLFAADKCPNLRHRIRAYTMMEYVHKYMSYINKPIC